MKRKVHRPIERPYVVTLVDGTKKTFVGTRLEQAPNGDVIIFNEWIAVGGFKRNEYKDLR
jgi:hypothetical protein